MEDRKCLNCGAEFTVKNKNINKKFCSVSCSNKYNWKNNPKALVGGYRPCKECGKQFKAKTQTQMFCDSECRELHNKKNRANQVPVYIKNCVNCGKEFMTKNKFGKYCSNKCLVIQNNLKKKRITEQKDKKGICSICGKEFNKVYEFEKYCSLECINIAQLNKFKNMEDKLTDKEKIVFKEFRGIIPYELFLDKLTLIYPNEAINKIQKTFNINEKQAKKIYSTCRKIFCSKVV